MEESGGCFYLKITSAKAWSSSGYAADSAGQQRCKCESVVDIKRDSAGNEGKTTERTKTKNAKFSKEKALHMPCSVVYFHPHARVSDSGSVLELSKKLSASDIK